MVMEQQLSNKLEYVHIGQPTQEILEYIDGRRRGTINSLKTRWHKFNRLCMGGLEQGSLITIAGVSGSGKSAMANSLETDLFELNPNEDFVVLSFSLEMQSSRQVGRKLSYRLKKTTSELYSGLDDVRANLSDADYEQVIKQAEKIKRYPIYYVDRPGNVEEIRNTIVDFIKNVAKGRWIIVIIDHMLLIKDKKGESERRIISDMQRIFIELKKYGKTTIVQLSQLNREIEDKDRISNPILHYPVRRDLAASDSIFQASDIVIVLHRPEALGIIKYGPSKLPVKNLIYMHVLKLREGEPKILVFENNLKHNSLEETNLYT